MFRDLTMIFTLILSFFWNLLYLASLKQDFTNFTISFLKFAGFIWLS